MAKAPKTVKGETFTISFNMGGKAVARFGIGVIEWIVELAKRKLDLSGSALARRVGVSRMAVHHWRHGTSRPSRSNLVKILGLIGGMGDVGQMILDCVDREGLGKSGRKKA
jgi:hypothetical protein